MSECTHARACVCMCVCTHSYRFVRKQNAPTSENAGEGEMMDQQQPPLWYDTYLFVIHNALATCVCNTWEKKFQVY